MEILCKPFQYGSFEGALDLADYVVCERWESAFQKFGEDSKKAYKSKTGSGKVKGIVLAITEVFDQVFPDQDASNRVLGGTTNLNEAASALDALIEYVNEQAVNSNRWKELAGKYTPDRDGRREK